MSTTLHAQDPTPVPAGPRQSRLKWVVGIACIALGIGGLSAWGMTSPGAVSYFATPTDVVTGTPAGTAQTLRLGGRIVPETMDRRGDAVSFQVTDGQHTVAVSYRGEIPDTLHEATDVVAEGSLDASGKLVATRVLAKCSSKFVPEAEQKARDAAATVSG